MRKYTTVGLLAAVIAFGILLAGSAPTPAAPVQNAPPPSSAAATGHQATGAFQRPAAPLAPADCTVTGSITTSDIPHTQTVNGLLGPGTCAINGCPNLTLCCASWYSDIYTFTNNLSTAQCITIMLDSTGCGGGALFSATYLTSFDPANPCLNYLGDGGAGGIQGSDSYQVTVPAGSTFVVDVENYASGATCASYTLAVSGDVAGPGCSLVNTPTPTSTPSGPPTSTATVTPTATVCTLQFVDVPPPDPFYSYIRCLYCRGIISSYTTNPPCTSGVPCFLPGNNTTRGQVAKFASNGAGITDPIPSTRQTFADVPPSSPFWLYVERLVAHNIISGYNTSPPCPAGQTPCFLPFNNVSRGQMIKIDSNAVGYADFIPPQRQTFEDVPPSNPFWVYIERLVMRHIISGYTCGGPMPCGPGHTRPYLLWANNLTRGQVSKIIANTFFPACQTP